MATRAVLARNGVETEVVYPSCCGMPQLEHGNIAEVAKKAETVSRELLPWIEKGYDVVALVPSCALMLKFERSEEHTSELQSLMRISYAVFCLKKKKNQPKQEIPHTHKETQHI